MFNPITIPSLPMDLLPTSYHPITYLITYLLLATYICIYLPKWLKLYIFHVVFHIWIVKVCYFEKYNMKFQELWNFLEKSFKKTTKIQLYRVLPKGDIKLEGKCFGKKKWIWIHVLGTHLKHYLIGTWVQIHFFPPKPFAFKVCSFELWCNFQV
jgi:hypothetical protein